MLRPGIESIRKAFLRFGSVLNACASFWIFLIMFLVTGDVLGRVLLNHPITGTPEFVKVSIVGIVFMQIPHTLWMRRHIRSEILIRRVNGAARELFNVFAYLLGLSVFLAIFISTWDATVTSWQILEFEGEGAVRIPTYPIRTLILLGSAMTAILYASRLFQSIRMILKNLWRH
jgi:TRAP-type mannitol/chloroaromatic compound transport system permease small subunit